MTAATVAFVQAMPGVPVRETECCRVQRRLNGRDLGQRVDAVPVLVDHPVDAAYLTLD